LHDFGARVGGKPRQQSLSGLACILQPVPRIPPRPPRLSANDVCFNSTSDETTDDKVDVTAPFRSQPARRLAPLPAWTLCTPMPASAPVGATDPAWLEFLGVDASGTGTPPGDPWLELLRR
jgi:hypothetical protein